ncbi:MAG: hypothetical protein HY094_02290 [Candidatus Melainabacteria bacterium]|nr:hypothetical protein [Candidatus Melainabacteria bacterium]
MFPLIGIPTLGAQDIAKGALNALHKGATFIDRYKWMKSAVGFLGSSLVFDENKLYGPPEKRSKEKPSGITAFLRRYVLANGYIIGALAWIAKYILSKTYQPKEGEQPSLIRSLTNLGTFILSIGAPIVALYSQIKGINVEWQCGEAGKVFALTDSFADNILKPIDNKKLVEEADYLQRIIRLDNGSDNEEGVTLQEQVESEFNASEGRKIILQGISQTGKSVSMRMIAGKLVKKWGLDKVIVKELNCTNMFEQIKAKLENEGGLASLLAAVPLDGAGEVKAQAAVLMSSSGTDVLVNLLKRISLEAKEAKEKGLKYIVLWDELDKIWRVVSGGGGESASYDPNLIGLVAVEIQKLIEDKNLNIIFTSNTPALEMCTTVGGNSETSPLVGLARRLHDRRIEFDYHLPHTQARIVASYLLDIQRRLKAVDAEIFDNDILPKLIGYRDDQDKEKKLAEVLFEQIFDRTKMSDDKKEVYRKLTGGSLKEAVSDRLYMKLTRGDKLVSGKKINLANLGKEIHTQSGYKNTGSEQNYRTPDVSQLQQAPKLTEQETAIVNKNIETLLGMDDKQLAATVASPDNASLMQVVLQIDSPKANELKARLIKLLSSQQQ